MQAPANIQLIGDEVAIVWPDGTESYIRQDVLRQMSPSAETAGERDVFGNQYGGARKDYAGVRVTGWEQVGNYAIKFGFSDGHGTGLYTYDYLRRLGGTPKQPMTPPMANPPSFPARTTTQEVELGKVLQPKFGADGLIPCITVDHATGDVLMFAFMNAQSLAHTIRTGRAAYWSRSRNKLWVKGEESGHVLRVVDLYVDCDQDVLLLRVENAGPGACHNGYRSCFYRRLSKGADPDVASSLSLEFAAPRAFDPAQVYPKK